ncbi:DUF6528 family protein [Actinoplanes sp. NPDC020271]|uniref:DUF6528 family protein n=1 Tax=Actinoplanes sp. NPDC020271 TaxID=3363896 RepID=UPI00379CC6AD
MAHLLLALALPAVITPAAVPPTAAAAAAASTPSLSPLVLSGPGNLVTRTQDTYITTADTADHSLGAFLHIGTPDNGVTKYRSLLQFDVSKLSGASIESASLRLYNSYTGSCDGWWMYADAVGKSWTASTVTWANQPGTVSGYGAAATFGIGNDALGCQDHPNATDPENTDGIFRLDVTAMVRAWASGALANNGLRLSAGEQETKAYKDFCAMNPASTAGPCAITYDIPTLEIKINPGRPVLAATNGATKRIEFYDGSAPAAWKTTGPFLWWAPDAYHSLTDTTLVPAGTWGGGVDVKLRPAGRYGPGQVLVVADNSSGFVGVVGYPALSGRKWAVNVGGTGVSNVHGAELMPDGNVAVALPLPGKVQIWSATAGQNWTPGTKPVAEVSLEAAHQVLYDPAGPWLWAVGSDKLVRYRYTPDAGTIAVDQEFPIPGQTKVSATAKAWGHDLTTVRGNPDRLWVTANGGVTQFSKSGTTCTVTDTATHWPDPASPGVGVHWCGDYPGVGLINANRMVKNIDDDPVSGTVTYVWGDLPGESNGSVINFVSGTSLVKAAAASSSVYYSLRWLVPAY